jgi:hypothetical protein
VLSWFAVDKEAPEEFKRLSYKAYLMCFGSTGMFEQDDVENWVSLTSTAAGSMARRLRLNSRMGMLADDSPVVAPLGPEEFAGPGVAHVGYGEYNQRNLLREWADHLERPVSSADTHEVGSQQREAAATSPNGSATAQTAQRTQVQR